MNRCRAAVRHFLIALGSFRKCFILMRRGKKEMKKGRPSGEVYPKSWTTGKAAFGPVPIKPNKSYRA